MSNHFQPANLEEHERGNAGHDVVDRCRNCGAPFMDHRNGVCPKKVWDGWKFKGRKIHP